MDYLDGLVSAVRENLHSAAEHLAVLTVCRYSVDLWILTRIQRNAHLYRNGIDARREARIDAHTAGVLRSAGSIRDTLAGVVVGVGGFDTDLMRADLRCLQPLFAGSDYPGRDVRKKLRADGNRPGSRRQAGRSPPCHEVVTPVRGPGRLAHWTRWSRKRTKATPTPTGDSGQQPAMIAPLPSQVAQREISPGDQPNGGRACQDFWCESADGGRQR